MKRKVILQYECPRKRIDYANQLDRGSHIVDGKTNYERACGIEKEQGRDACDTRIE